jgi:hypothetical protein
MARSIEKAGQNCRRPKGRIGNDAAFSMSCAQQDGSDGDAMAAAKTSEN